MKQQLIKDVLEYATLAPNTFLSSPEIVAFFNPIPIGVLCLTNVPDEISFLEKLTSAIDKQLRPAQLISMDQVKSCKWIISYQPLDFKNTITISPPSYYVNNFEAKKALWKILCEKFAPSS